VVEMTETDEEAVVSKTARVKEEVVLRKDATERTETVRDSVRREDVEITKDGSIEGRADTTARPTTDQYNSKV
jgi:stress response protein YsnF